MVVLAALRHRQHSSVGGIAVIIVMQRQHCGIGSVTALAARLLPGPIMAMVILTLHRSDDDVSDVPLQ